jgi:hypothetical protein
MRWENEESMGSIRSMGSMGVNKPQTVNCQLCTVN